MEGGFRFLPNLPDGQYAIVVFDTLFGAPAATPSIHTEQFTLGRDAARGSAWELVDAEPAIAQAADHQQAAVVD